MFDAAHLASGMLIKALSPGRRNRFDETEAAYKLDGMKESGEK